MAEKVTRIYKRESSKILLDSRNSFWNVLVTINILAILLAYPTSLLCYIYEYKNHDTHCDGTEPRESVHPLEDAHLDGTSIREYDCAKGPGAVLAWTFPVKGFTDTNQMEQTHSWLELLGIYKHGCIQTDFGFYAIRLALLGVLFIEKASIVWLTNRFGCTHSKIQQIIELKLRNRAN